MYIGIDFGTTNSSVALLDDKQVRLAEFGFQGGHTSSFRSVLYFSFEQAPSSQRPAIFAGPQALDQYLEEFGSGRIIQSLKSFLSNASFESTQVLATKYSLEQMIGLFLIELREQTEKQLGPLGRRALVGRPVKYVGGENKEREELALDRMRKALSIAGFDQVQFELEPIAAAYTYEKELEHDQCILVADFGGGTSDFCVALVGPQAKKLDPMQRILGIDGVGLAGDAFDGRIVTELLAPLLGKGGSYRSMGGKELSIPIWPFQKLSSWHELSFLRSQDTLTLLHELSSLALDPVPLKRLLYLLQENLGFHLYQKVEGSKRELTDHRQSQLMFDSGELQIEELCQRDHFEQWISGELELIEQSMLRALESAERSSEQIDRVFMTGGTAFVPRVRQLFEKHFGAEKLASGNELSSVGTGLALRARDLDRA